MITLISQRLANKILKIKKKKKKERITKNPSSVKPEPCHVVLWESGRLSPEQCNIQLRPVYAPHSNVSYFGKCFCARSNVYWVYLWKGNTHLYRKTLYLKVDILYINVKMCLCAHICTYNTYFQRYTIACTNRYGQKHWIFHALDTDGKSPAYVKADCQLCCLI